MIVATPNQKISNSEDIDIIIRNVMNLSQEEDKHKERFYVLGLNSANTIQFIDLSSIGSVNKCYPVMREIIKIALDKNSTAIIVAHNHPSGETRPSKEDIVFTRKLLEACKLMEITLLDHIICGDKAFHSFADCGEI